MNLNKSRTVSVFVLIALIEISIIGSLSIAQTDQNLIDVEEASGQIVKIGVIYNLEGSQSSLDLPSARGAGLAAQEINFLGGIDGKGIELIFCDGKSDPSEVRECAEGLIDENVSAMMGLSDTDMVLAAVPVAASARIPFVTSGATSPKLVEEYEGLFLACFGDNVQAAAGAEYAYNEMGLKTCALLVDGDMEYARLLAGNFEDRYQDLGGDIIMATFVNGSDLGGLSKAIMAHGPDMIYLAAGPEGAYAIIEEVRAVGIECPIFGGDSLDSSELKEEGMGMIAFSTHALLKENSSSSGKFISAYQEEYGHTPENAFSALGYDTVSLLADAIDRADSDDPQAILEALKETSGFKGVTGEISYLNANRIPNKGVTMIVLINGDIVSSEIVTPEPSI